MEKATISYDSEKTRISSIENDKDIVFALKPEILIEASVNPEKVEGMSCSHCESAIKKMCRGFRRSN